MYLICKRTSKDKIVIQKVCNQQQKDEFSTNVRLAVYYDTAMANTKAKPDSSEHDELKGQYLKVSCEIAKTFPYRNIYEIMNTYKNSFIFKVKSVI